MLASLITGSFVRAKELMLPLRLTLVRLVAPAMFIYLSFGSPVLAAGPQDTIRQTAVAVTAVLGDAEIQGPDKEANRKARIATIIHNAFDFEEMARDSLGMHWTELTPAQREEFTRLFGDLFTRSYSRLVLKFLGERKTVYVGESIEGSRAVVRTFLVSEKEGRMPVEYRLASRGDRWAVVDVILDGVSLAMNYRAQFSKVLRSSSYEALLRRMKNKGE